MSEATFSELDELELWINDGDNEKEFSYFVKTNYLIEYHLKKFSANTTKEKLHELIKAERRVRRLKRIRRFSSYAAIFIGVLVSVYVVNDKIFNASSDKENPVIVNTNTTIEPGTDKATLTLEDGSHVALEKGASFQRQNVKSNGEEIIYESKDQGIEDIVHHYLTIPRGGEYHIKLSDGTRVWLNSESQLKFPVNFLKGKTRYVELVYGEAYFDVSSSEENDDSKFIVLNKSQEVEVLGTQFNVKAYRDEDHIYTTLVEGEVAVTIEDNSQKLTPNQQLNLDVKTKSSSIKTVDVYSEISWKDGIFSFKGKPLKDIMKVLSRWYDIDVVFKNEALETITFKGVLGKDQKIEEILETIKTLSVLEEYQITNNIIILK